MNFKSLQEYAEYLTVTEGWRSETYETRMAYLRSEVDEVQRALDTYLAGEIELDKGPARRQLGMELFDVLWNVAELANRCGISLEEAAEHKMKHNAKRTFSTDAKERFYEKD